jgi:queuosine precursor transporter
MTHQRKQYRYFDLIMAAFVCILLCANLIGASKVAVIRGFTFGAGVIFFPVSYLFGDVLTEVYGYAQTRRVVWTGFAAMAFASAVSWLIISLPPAPGWPYQQALVSILGSTWRIVCGSLLAFFCGEFCNSYVLAKLKIRNKGRFLWMRFIGSTMVGEGIDTLLFYPIAFYGFWSNDLLGRVMLGNYAVKVAWEVIATPFTYLVVGWLKRVEHEDYYDYHTDFNPFHMSG